MRTTWIILVIMLVLGAGMYFLFNYKKNAPPAEYDTITVTQTADSIVKRLKVYVANNPTEVYYSDSAWFTADSTPLKKVLDASTLDYMDKHYRSVTLFITYNDQAFYDLEINKPDSLLAYKVNLQLSSKNDTLYIAGLLDRKAGDIVSFQGPLMPVYKQFAITYNNKLPPPPPDTTAASDTSRTDTVPQGPLPNKTITVLRN